MRAVISKSNLIRISFLTVCFLLFVVIIPVITKNDFGSKLPLLFWITQIKERFIGQKGKSETATPKVSIFKPLLEPLYALPVRLYTEGAKLDAQLTQVSVETNGTLGVPVDWESGGWYKKSSKPGQKGNIVINGHYDTNTGAPAAFWELKSLKNNDKVYLVDELGKVYTYKVVDSFYIDIQDPDRLRIFESPNDRYEMTLITCGGVWLPLEGYSKRLVIKAELVNS